MIIQIINEISRKYNLDLNFKLKFSKVYIITFEINKTEITFNFFVDTLKSYKENLKDFENRLNKEIISYFINQRKGEKIR